MDDATPVKRKRGRPKGSKNKPKWLKELLAKQPKRPPGRPKGSKNKPKTLEQFVAAALATSVDPPKVPQRKYPNKYRPQLNAISPEERSSRAAKAHSKVKNRRSRPPAPVGWTQKQYLLARHETDAEARRIMKIMAKNGTLPEDPEAQEAMETVLKLMRGPGSNDFKLKAARSVLEWKMPKPTAKAEVTVKTAEDFLDELADGEDSEEVDSDE